MARWQGIARLVPDWPAPPGVIAFTTLRCGGVSTGAYASLNLGDHVGDSVSAVRENRRRLRADGALPAEPAWLGQVHGTRVVTLPGGSERPEADAAVTREPDVVCAVLTADCLPVVLARRDGTAVGVAHAGWRGLVAGVLEATATALGGDLQAWLGPAISQPTFEVGDEVRDAFMAGQPGAGRHFRRNAAGRWQADLYGLARQRLQAAGVKDVYGGDRCTATEAAAFFSYRRDGICGRMATVAWRVPASD